MQSCSANAKASVLVLALAPLCYAAPVQARTVTTRHGKVSPTLSAAQMMMNCCFIKGSTSLCDVMHDGIVYCLADGLPPAQWDACVYQNGVHPYGPLWLVRCTTDPVANPIAMPENPSLDRCECYDKVGMSDRHDMLMQQLLDIHHVFDKLRIVNILAYGTASDALRGHGINNLENPNNLYVSSKLRLTPELRAELHRVGLLMIVLHGIFRVCKLSPFYTKEVTFPEPDKVPSKVCPYTDLYPTNLDTMKSTGAFVDWGSGKSYELPVPLLLDSVQIRSTPFKILPRSITFKILEYWYGHVKAV